ncbi:MAG: DUF104 domain-containing protein [Chloroflexi bacterium]|nr:DUF104 domain-containing protein [Chloroflexota bacterium]
MTTSMVSGDDMLKKVRGKVSHGKIEPLEEIDLEEGEEVVILVSIKDKPRSLFGLLKGSATIKGDIIAPVDVDWDALR